jgi:hypothetical protein
MENENELLFESVELGDIEALEEDVVPGCCGCGCVGNCSAN